MMARTTNQLTVLPRRSSMAFVLVQLIFLMAPTNDTVSRIRVSPGLKDLTAGKMTRLRRISLSEHISRSNIPR